MEKQQKHESLEKEPGPLMRGSGRPVSEGQLVCWLASSMPLERKIEAAVAAMPRASKGARADPAVSPRLACAVLQFSANALLRSTSSTASSHGRASEPRKDNRDRGFLRESLWSLVLGCLQTAPDQVASTLSGVGGHLIRPIHFAMLAVMQRCRDVVCRKNVNWSEGDGVDCASLAATVGAVLLLLRGPHAASFQPQLPALCGMLASLSAELTSLLEGVAMRLSSEQIESESDDTAELVEEGIASVHRAAYMVGETISTVALAVGRAPNQRKIFAMAVEDLLAPAALHFRACANLHQRVLSLESSHGGASRLAETAVGDGWKVYRKMQALIGESIFSQEHLADFALAYSFRSACMTAAGADEAEDEKPDADTGSGLVVMVQGRSKKMKGVAGSGYRGDKLKSYQASLFAKLLSATRSSVTGPSVAMSDGDGKIGAGRVKAGKMGKARAGGKGEVENTAREGHGGDEQGLEETREAILMWLPELLRLFVICGRRCADPSAEVDGLELAFGEQSAGSLIGGSSAGGPGGRGRATGEVAGKSRKRKKDGEHHGGAVAEMGGWSQGLF